MADYNLGTASGRIVVDGSAAEVGFNVARTAAGAFFDAVKFRVNEVQQLGKRMAAVGAAGVAGFGVAVKVASSFEQQMSGVKAVAGATEDQFESLRQKALDLGKDTAYSASEAAGAIEELVKAGISVEDVLNGAADAAVALAAAGGISIPEAATIAANAMNQFELSAKKVPKVADILAGVANTSAADVTSLGTSLSQAGAVANLAGLSFKDTAIALGEMADAGINGSDAGTSLKTMLNNLIPTTEKQRAKFKELELLEYDLADANKTLAKENLGTADSMNEARGKLAKYLSELGKGEIGTMKLATAVDELLMKNGGLSNSFFDAQGNVKNLAGLQGTLAKALKDMTREQKLGTLETLFGADAMRATAILSLEGAKGYREFAKAVGETKAADVAAVRLDNLAGSQEALKGSLETVAIEAGSIFLPALTLMIQAITKLINIFLELPSGVKTAVYIIGAFLSAGLLVTGMILALLPLIASMLINFLAMRAISSVISGFRVFFGVLRAGTGVMAATAAGASTTGNALSRLTARTLLASKAAMFTGRAFMFMWAGITGPIGIAVAAIAGIIALGVLLYKKWEPFRNLVDSIVVKLRAGLAAAVAFLTPIINQVVAAFQKFGAFVSSTLMPILRQVGAELLGKLLSGFKSIMSAIQTQLMPALKSLGGTVQNELLPALRSLWSAIQPIIQAFLKYYTIIFGLVIKAVMALGKAFISYVLPILIKVAGFIGGFLIDTVVGFVKAVIQVITGVIQIFQGLISFITGIFTGNWSQAWDGIKTMFTGFLNLILGLVKAIFYGSIFKVFGLAFKGFMAVARLGWTAIVALFKIAGKLLINLVKAPFTLMRKIIQVAMRAAMAIIRAIWGFITRIFGSAATRVTSTVSKMVSGVINFFKNLWTNALALVQRLSTGIGNTVRSMATRFVQIIRNLIDDVLTFFRELPGQILGFMKGLADDMYQVGKDIIMGMVNGIKSMAGAAADAAKGVASGALNGVKGFLGIGSPSKVFHEIGGWTIEGQEEGMEDRKRSLERKSTDMARALVDAWGAGMKQFDPNSIPTIERAPSVTYAEDRRAASQGRRRADAQEAAKKALGDQGRKRLRLVEGRLRIDSESRAWVEGIAEDVYEGNDEYEDVHDRMNGLKKP